jgi:hypothetical protein
MNTIHYRDLISRFSILAIILFSISYFAYTGSSFDDNDLAQKWPQKHSQVRIYAVNDYDFFSMQSYDLFIDHAHTKPGQYIETWLSEYEILKLDRSGVPYDILVDDWDAYYEQQKAQDELVDIDAINKTPYNDWIISHSIYGSMGGYLTYAQITSKLDSLSLEYPQYVSPKFSIGNTFENRQQWVVKITKNPGTPNTRPQVWMHGLIHAREPESMTQQLYFVYWLLENANSNPEAKYILENREIHWMPVYNPDGYVHNQTTNPSGGGMWRCNKKPCNTSTSGTDLNRNFGTYIMWNSSNGGSSTFCSGGQSTYRGPYPFSEPENINVATYVNSKLFKTAASAHTYGNLLIKPWCYLDPIGTPDDAKFNYYFNDMKATNGYTAGFPSQTVGYKVRGGTDDWYYQDSGHAKIFGYTPETGPSFWPPQSQMLPLAQGMLYSNIYWTMIAGAWVNPTSLAFNNTYYTPGQAGTYKVKFMNKGIEAAANVKVIWTPGNNKITIPTQQYNYASLASFAQDSSTFNFTVAADAPNNCAIPTTLTIKLDTTTIFSQAVYVYVGQGTVTFNDQANSFANWTGTGPWNITTTQSYSAPSSFTDSPTGSYGSNIDYSMTLTNPINVYPQPVVYLSFWHKYTTEAGYDFCRVEVSSNNGSTWQEIKNYAGTLSVWTQQSFDITQYANATTQLKIRFRLTSDESLTYDGWYIDDVKLTNYCLGPVGISGNNELPNVFALMQNYPNPFNPSTLIKYQLPNKSLVTIKVFDILGKQVAELINETKDAGYHQVNFDASNLASGLYFYRISVRQDGSSTVSFEDTKKMMLVK